jgi:hypothetical protein
MYFTKAIMRQFNYKLRTILALTLFIVPGIRLAAQFDVFPNEQDSSRYESHRILLTRDVDTTGEIPFYGPNRLFFAHGLAQLGGKPGPQYYGAQTNWWSYSLEYGLRMKLKLWSWESLTMDIGYRYDRFSLRMDTPRLAPLDNTHHQREKISLHNFSGAFCERINFGKRGNVMGTWLDIGVYGDWAFRTGDVYVDQHYDSNSPSGYRYKSKTKINRLPYMEKINYGFTARLGGDYVGIFAMWRWNDLIKQSYTSSERDLPKLTIGIEVYNWD